MQAPDTTEQHLREWLRECPALASGNRFRVDYLSEASTEYTLNASPSSLSYRENILGERVLQDNQYINYVFAARVPYGAEVTQNLQNLEFFRQVTAWIIEQNNTGNFPEISEGRVTAITPTLSAYPVTIGSAAAKYQIQIRIDYRRT